MSFQEQDWHKEASWPKRLHQSLVEKGGQIWKPWWSGTNRSRGDWMVDEGEVKSMALPKFGLPWCDLKGTSRFAHKRLAWVNKGEKSEPETPGCLLVYMTSVGWNPVFTLRSPLTLSKLWASAGPPRGQPIELLDILLTEPRMLRAAECLCFHFALGLIQRAFTSDLWPLTLISLPATFPFLPTSQSRWGHLSSGKTESKSDL